MCRLSGILIGLASFLIIGIFHPIVIKAEYHFSKRIWPVFLVVGLVCIGIAFWLSSLLPSAIVSIVGFTCLWSIKELFEQEQRVRKGWFPKNPKRDDYF